VRRHRFRRRCPHLPVVRVHEQARDPGSKRRLHPQAEVHLRVASGGGGESVEALGDQLVGQVAKVVLERVRHPPIVEAHVRGPIMAEDLLAHHLAQQRIERVEVAEHDVPAEVPGEPGRVDNRGREPAGAIAALEDQPVIETQAAQLARTRQAAWAGANDQDPPCLHVRSESARRLGRPHSQTGSGGGERTAIHAACGQSAPRAPAVLGRPLASLPRETKAVRSGPDLEWPAWTSSRGSDAQGRPTAGTRTAARRPLHAKAARWRHAAKASARGPRATRSRRPDRRT
jgi:hypothetical protein